MSRKLGIVCVVSPQKLIAIKARLFASIPKEIDKIKQSKARKRDEIFNNYCAVIDASICAGQNNKPKGGVRGREKPSRI